jgi:hypothetical protein
VTRVARLLALPEANVFFFGVLVNLPWELLQIPFFDGMSRAPHWQATKVCSLAAVGDGALLLGAYWVTAAMARSRQWVLHPRLRDVLVLLSVAQVMNALFEWLNTEIWQRWAYIPAMPTVPLLGTGLAPVLQWLCLAPLVIWIVGRQIRGELARDDRGGSPR